MRWPKNLMLTTGFALAVLFAAVARGQGGNGGGDDDGGDASPSGGVEINADGVLRLKMLTDPTGMLDRQKAMAAKAKLSPQLQQPSPMRMVSINRLESEIARLRAEGKPIPAEMRYLAGLTRVEYVFFYPHSKDIVIAGPAEGFFLNGQNRVVGTETGQATLHLEDLIVALRAFGPEGDRTRVISCSIDPTPEGTQRLRDTAATLQRNIRQLRAGDEVNVVQAYRQALGLQVVTIQGVPPTTRFARIMTEADYNMKLIGMGLFVPPVPIVTWIQNSEPAAVSSNALIRWFFQPNYDRVHVSQDGLAMQLVGNGVRLAAEDDRVDGQGNRRQTGQANRASRLFCESFTNNYEALSQRMQLYGELRNLIDLSIAAAFIQKSNFYQMASWNMSLFGSESQMPVEIHPAPQYVEPVVNAYWKNNMFVCPIAGGVNFQPRVALNSDRIKQDADGAIEQKRQAHGVENLAEGQWWWD
ncbi:MAG TPA: DUF1598 domain-containing protein [Pirellulaceae bacterium]|nr:DUF1598 domain-containing protein [Pirellulaceae bacterium]